MINLDLNETKCLLKLLYLMKGEVVEDMFQTDDPIAKENLEKKQVLLIRIIKKLEQEVDYKRGWGYE